MVKKRVILPEERVELEKNIKEIIHTIIEMTQPKQIIWFGSRVRGTAHRYSDYDIAVTGVDMVEETRWRVEERIFKGGNMTQVNQETLDKIILDEIIQRIVKIASPEKIILFGSVVRGEMGSNSDIDLLVIKSNIHRRRLAQEIYKNLFGVGRAVDVIVATPEDIERYKDSFALAIEPALREGKVIYAYPLHMSG